jgi:hypothetical protein
MRRFVENGSNVEYGGNEMIKKKPYDGVVVAVRYTPQGNIDWVRAFERHGFVFTDRMMMKRDALVERLKAGKVFKTGERLIYQGNDFEVNDEIHWIEKNGDGVIVAGEASSDHDSLGELPII